VSFCVFDVDKTVSLGFHPKKEENASFLHMRKKKRIRHRKTPNYYRRARETTHTHTHTERERESHTYKKMSNWTGGQHAADEDRAKLEDFEKRIDPNNKQQTDLLEEMRRHTEHLEKSRKYEDPRLSFSTPEFKEASRKFQARFNVNFDRPVEFGMVKKYPWSTPTLQKLDVPVDVDGNPWPLDENGKPILKEGVDMEPSKEFERMAQGSR
jgi:hypothetical protein